MTDGDIWQNAEQLETIMATMARDLQTRCQERGIDRPLMVGIHTGGVWVAERLHQLLGLEEPLGFLDISFYRDDFTRIGLHPQVHPSELPVAVDDRAVILVDDVLQSGRTIRAALNVLFDYGRPSQVLLAILAERDGRELPINPDVVGLHAELAHGNHIKLSGPEPLRLEQRAAPKDQP
ncbi:Bifunctional protein PyrR [Thiorhodovibrio winogradskyi]|uniref:Bifunctional protein PyrR n=1 Tax=Thiorhodovibrio winogradskyi TaxID=77007 RepID=A0ABZ0S5A1_9GAMM|nr:bifunctional pyr operon transcriptional regulator/uracil phosphoribosyltransferase PyrR [Thiorhodovibrio winogradskyi]